MSTSPWLDSTFSESARFLVAFLATIPAIRRSLSLPISSATLTPPIHGGSGIAVDTTFVPLILLLSAASITCRLASSTTNMGSLYLHVHHLCCRYAYSSTHLSGFLLQETSIEARKMRHILLVQTAVQNAMNFDANPLRKTCII